MDVRCKGILFRAVEGFIEFTDHFSVEDRDDFSERLESDATALKLQIIAVPYKEGSHHAKKLTDFKPIIQQLQK
jgi:hypothetical protein